MSEPKQLTADAAALRPRPLIPPYPLRAAAYLVDIVILYFIGYTLETFARDPLLSLGPLLPFFSIVGMFLYFWLGNGPVGKGATFGKSILNMHTVRMDGGVPGWKESFQRTLLHFPPVYTALFYVFRDGLDLAQSWTAPIGSLFSIFSIFMFSLNGFAMLVHPFRRGLHDLGAKLMVVGDPTPGEFSEVVEKMAGEEFVVEQRSRRKTLYFFGAVVVIILGGQWLLATVNPDSRRLIGALDLFNREADLGAYHISQIGLPISEKMAKAHGLKEIIVGFVLKKDFGPLKEREVKSDEFMAVLNNMREKWNELAPTHKFISPPTHPAPAKIMIVVADPFMFGFFPPRQGQLNAWRAEAPTDPALGGFTLTKIDFEEKKKEGQAGPDASAPTTGTLPVAK